MGTNTLHKLGPTFIHFSVCVCVCPFFIDWLSDRSLFILLIYVFMMSGRRHNWSFLSNDLLGINYAIIHLAVWRIIFKSLWWTTKLNSLLFLSLSPFPSSFHNSPLPVSHMSSLLLRWHAIKENTFRRLRQSLPPETIKLTRPNWLLGSGLNASLAKSLLLHPQVQNFGWLWWRNTTPSRFTGFLQGRKGAVRTALSLSSQICFCPEEGYRHRYMTPFPQCHLYLNAALLGWLSKA